MLKQPSSRRKSSGEKVDLNLVPIIDTMVTLIGFMLFTTSFLAVVSIESPFPQMSPEQVQEKLKEKPLQLTITVRENETEIWSPFDKFPPKKIANQVAGSPDIKAIHEQLVGLKQKFPKETKAVLVPVGGTSYDTLITVMDGIRMVDATDPPIFVKDAATGNDVAVKTLFPEIIFGNLLGDS